MDLLSLNHDSQLQRLNKQQEYKQCENNNLKRQLQECEDTLVKSQSNYAEANEMLSKAQESMQLMQNDMNDLMKKSEAIMQKHDHQRNNLNQVICDGKAKLVDANQKIDQMNARIEKLLGVIAKLQQSLTEQVWQFFSPKTDHDTYIR